MKPIFRTLIVAVLSLSLLTGVAFAASENTVSDLPKGQTVNSLYARAATTVTVNGEVNGDVWVAGEKVEVNGIVRGNVYAAGSEVSINGEVTGSVHAAGSTVEVDGKIGGSVYAAGSEVTVKDSTKVAGAVALAGSKVAFGGDIIQQAYVAGSSLDMSARVGQSANLAGADISLNDQAKVNGDLTYRSENDARIANDKAIGGNLKHDVVEKSERNPMRDKIMGALIGLVMNVVIGFVLVLFASRLLKVTDTVLKSDMTSVILKGMAFIILAPLACIFIAITFIGIPLAIVGLLLYIALLILVPAIASYSLGRLVFQKALHKEGKKSINPYQAVIVGCVAFTIISLVPFVGGIAEFILIAGGAGALVSRGFKPLQTKKA